MIFSPRILLFPVLAALALLQSCGSGQLAGGSGAGNPGSAVALAAVAEGAGMQKAAAQTDSGRSLVVRDANGLEFLVTSAVIRTQEIRFVFDAAFDCGDGFWEEHPQLHCVGDAAILSGALAFDAMNATVDPALQGVVVPAAAYSSIKLQIASPGYGRDSVPPAMEISGTFRFQGVPRDFLFRLDVSAMMAVHRSDSAVVALNAGDTSGLQIVLDAGAWLQNVAINDNLRDRLLAFDPDGTLRIDGSNAIGAARVVHNLIAQNILDAVALRVEGQ